MNDLLQDEEPGTSNFELLEQDPSLSVPQPLLPAVEITLETAARWHFDAFQLEEATSGRPLSVLGFYLLNKLNLTREFGAHSALRAQSFASAAKVSTKRAQKK